MELHFMKWKGSKSDLQVYKIGLEKAEEPEIKFPTFIGSQRKQENSRKTSTSTSLTTLTPLIMFSSVTQSCPTLCDPMNHSTPGFPIHHQLPESNQTHVHWVGDDIQPSHPLSSPSPPALNLSQHQGLFKWVSSSHQGAKVLEFHLQHQSFQWTPRADLL